MPRKRSTAAAVREENPCNAGKKKHQCVKVTRRQVGQVSRALPVGKPKKRRFHTARRAGSAEACSRTSNQRRMRSSMPCANRRRAYSRVPAQNVVARSKETCAMRVKAAKGCVRALCTRTRTAENAAQQRARCGKCACVLAGNNVRSSKVCV